MGGGPSAQQMLLMHQQMQAMIESATPLETAPMSVGEFVGWRIWQVRSRERLLLSYSANAIWMPGEPMDGKPSDHGDEGVWCFKDKMRAFQKAASEASINLCAVGSVYLWGNVVEHEIGYRAEFAEVRSIDHAPGAPYLLSALRARYGVGSAEDADSADQHAERGIGRGGAAVVDDC